MTIHRTIAILFSLFAWVWTGMASAAKRSPEDLERWAAEMGDRDFKTREAATRELWLAGSAAMRVLDPAARDRENPERMLRARDLIRKIRFELTPETDGEVVAWVEEYEKASTTEKMRILDEMRKKRAFLPMLRLYGEEKDPKDRKLIEPKLKGVAELAARESLLANDLERASIALSLAPSGLETMVSRAVLLRLQGKLESEWNGMNQEQRLGPWGLAVARVLGSLPEARAAAQAQEKAELAAALAVLAGDPVPWIQLRNRASSSLELEYIDLATRRWRGDALVREDFSRLSKFAEGALGTSRLSATHLLFLLGRNDLAEAALIDHSPLQAFQYFDQLEMIPEALESLGLDPEKPDYNGWFERALRQFRRGDPQGQPEFSRVDDELVEMARFLESRGLHKQLEDALMAPLLEYGKQEQFEFLDLLSMLLGSGGQIGAAPGFAIKVAEQWVGEEPERWEEILINVFGDSEDVLGWWKRIGEREPKLSRANRFRVLLLFYRIGADPEKMREQWLQRLVKEGEERPELWKPLHDLAVMTQDAGLYGDVVDGVDDRFRDEVYWGSRIYFLSALDRWQDVVAVLEAHLEASSKGGESYSREIQVHAYLASSLRLCGKEAEACRQDELVERLYLGNSLLAAGIADGYAFGRDYERAAMWWTRACVEGSPFEGNSVHPSFFRSVDSLASHWLERGDWKMAAALSECELRWYANPNLQLQTPGLFTQLRLQADTARALGLYPSQPELAMSILEESHRSYRSHGSLADVFFPSLRRAGVMAHYDEWFGDTWKFMREVIARYPGSDNTCNTAAWIASRACRELEQGAKDIASALSQRPEQAAYLDTMAEMQFALGNRESAAKWSRKAMKSKPEDAIIRSQHTRFLSAPLPR